MSDPISREHILLLEDDPNLGEIIRESLELRGFDVSLRPDGEQGLAAFAAGTVSLCLVDVMMPAVDGFAFAAEVRRRGSDVPLIFLTARSLVEDRIEGFRAGCDDYVTKPFSMEELLLRIDAVLRRRRPDADPPLAGTVPLGAFRFDIDARVLALAGDDRTLTEREAGLLELLCRRRNRTLDRSEALLALWGDDSYHNGRSMDVFISRLRRLLADDPAVEIRTIHGRGYRLVVRD
jgi:DNA-binding response OmpR family regulator